VASRSTFDAAPGSASISPWFEDPVDAVKMFQIEEPDGSPSDPDAPGVAIGVGADGLLAEVAVSVGGNAMILADRDGFELDLAVPPPTAPEAAWRDLFEGTRLRAERALGRPVTHAVVALASMPEPALADRLRAAGDAAGIAVLRVIGPADTDGGDPPAMAAAVVAEDLAPRPDSP